MVVIRRVEASDRDCFRTLLSAFFEHAGNAWPGDERFEEFFNTSRDGLVFLGAFEGDALLGIVSLARVESSYEFRPFAYCDDLYVSADARGRGFGRLLMEEVARVAAEWGASSILLGAGDDPDARAFYRRLGFGKLGELLVLGLADR